MHFPAIWQSIAYSLHDFYIFLGQTTVCIWVKLKLVKYFRYFSWYNFENLIRTLQCQLERERTNFRKHKTNTNLNIYFQNDEGEHKEEATRP